MSALGGALLAMLAALSLVTLWLGGPRALWNEHKRGTRRMERNR